MCRPRAKTEIGETRCRIVGQSVRLPSSLLATSCGILDHCPCSLHRSHTCLGGYRVLVVRIFQSPPMHPPYPNFVLSPRGHPAASEFEAGFDPTYAFPINRWNASELRPRSLKLSCTEATIHVFADVPSPYLLAPGPAFGAQSEGEARVVSCAGGRWYLRG